MALNVVLLLICLVSPLVAACLIVFPVLWLKYHVPPEYRKWQQEVKQINDGYQFRVMQYNKEKQMNEYSSLSDLVGMNPHEFERHIAYCFTKMGYNVTVTGQTGDHGIDLVANNGSESAVIQCKRYILSNKIGSPAIRNFIGSMSLTTARTGYFITTSSFTRPAIMEARKVGRIKLIDGKGIVQLWERYSIGPFQNLVPPKQPSLPPEPLAHRPTNILGFKVWQWIVLVVIAETALLTLIFTISKILSQLNF